ncbi:MAG: energy-coupling factor transporter ATPase [Clostridia bacterium]|nr:energy-coupling factor transporter ATPase [Clostridia bacterium]
MSIVVKNLNFTYMPKTPFEKKALSDIDLEINKGEFVAVIGHTGSGKSTLLQHFNGLLTATEGEIYVDGEKIVKKNLYDIRKKVGFVFQYPEHQLFADTVYKDIAFGLKRFGLTEEETKERIEKAAKLVGLDEALFESSVFELSGGEKRRAALCGVLVSEPEYLLLDEPASGLDPKGRREMLELLKKLNEKGVTVILISHSMDDVAEVAGRVIVMNKGSIALDGTPEQIFSDPELLGSMGLDIPEITKMFRAFSERSVLSLPVVTTRAQGKALIEKLISEGRLVQ